MELSQLYTEASLVGVSDELVDMMNKISSDLAGSVIEPWDKKTSNRMWTRGDGSRYKEPSRISAMREYKYYAESLPEFKKKFPTIDKFAGAVMDKLFRDSKFKKVGQVSGEFTSDNYSDAYTYKNLLTVRNSTSVMYASKSILKNSDVWKIKK